MATTPIEVTVDYTEALAAGSGREINLHNRRTWPIEYIVATEAPGSGDIGAVIDRDDIHPVKLVTGESLYVRWAQRSPGMVTMQGGLVAVDV